jgi:hypothetical protein
MSWPAWTLLIHPPRSRDVIVTISTEETRAVLERMAAAGVSMSPNPAKAKVGDSILVTISTGFFKTEMV